MCVCKFVRSFLPPRACRSRNIGTNGFTTTQKKLHARTYISVYNYNTTKLCIFMVALQEGQFILGLKSCISRYNSRIM